MLAVPSSSHDFDGSLSAVATLSQELHTAALPRPHVPGRDTAGETAGLVTTFVVETDIGATSCRTVVVAKAAAGKAHALTDSGKDTLLAKMPSQQGDFSKPGWRRGDRPRCGLDDPRSISDTVHVDLLVENGLILPHQGDIFLSGFATFYTLVAHFVGERSGSR